MGHNITARKRSAEVLRTPLDQFHGWHLEVDCRCPDCPRGRAYVVRDLAGMYRGPTLGDAVRRMRCDRCGKPPATVMLRPGPELLGPAQRQCQSSGPPASERRDVSVFLNELDAGGF